MLACCKKWFHFIFSKLNLLFVKINGIFEDSGILDNTIRNYLNIGEKLSVLCVALFVILILLLSD